MLLWMEGQLRESKRVLIHCVGGLGRAGTVAACLVKSRGIDGQQAIDLVREVRSRRAIETAEQERFVRNY